MVNKIPKSLRKQMAKTKKIENRKAKKQAKSEAKAIANSPYFEDGNPKLTISICCFLDVLGYTAQNMNEKEPSSAVRLLNDFYTAHNEALGISNAFANEGIFYAKTFSDNILLAKPFDFLEDDRFTRDNNGEAEFATIMHAITNYQLDMALKGFFTRGGLTYGPLFMDDKTIFGSALIEAHDLESKKAVNPIVLCSDELKKLLDIQLREYSGSDEDPPHASSVYIQEDGSYFLNYLSAAAPDGTINTEKIRLHKTLVEQELIKNAEIVKVHSKYRWLAGYHNYFCDLNSHLPGYSEDLKIQDRSIKFGNLKKQMK